jgi:hypothetical protein
LLHKKKTKAKTKYHENKVTKKKNDEAAIKKINEATLLLSRVNKPVANFIKMLKSKLRSRPHKPLNN